MAQQFLDTGLTFKVDRTPEVEKAFYEKLKTALSIPENAKRLPCDKDLLLGMKTIVGFELTQGYLFWIDWSSTCPKLQIQSAVNVDKAGIFVAQLPLQETDLKAISERGISGVISKFWDKLESYRSTALKALAP